MLWKVGCWIVCFLAADMFARSMLPGQPTFLYFVLAFLACSPLIFMFAYMEKVEGDVKEQEEADAIRQRREEEEHQARLDAIRNPKP